jgi:hypothetical protein
MAQLQLHRGRPVHELAADLRRAFSGIVAGNVKEEGIRAIEAHGPYELTGEPASRSRLRGSHHSRMTSASRAAKPSRRFSRSRSCGPQGQRIGIQL